MCHYAIFVKGESPFTYKARVDLKKKLSLFFLMGAVKMHVFKLLVSFNQSTRKENGKNDVPFLSFAYRLIPQKNVFDFLKK